jgi:CubicO group peptidase (beta-lactamase class C family)
MSYFLRLFVVFASVLLFVQGGSAQTNKAAPPTGVATLTPSDLDNWLAGFMDGAMKSNQIVGAQVVVVKDGKIFLQRGYGYADYAKKIPVDPENTLFRPGSISKLFTWTAVMQLVEQGKINLDTDINAYLDFKIVGKNGKRITVRHLMTHRAGFEDPIKTGVLYETRLLHPLGTDLKGFVPARIYEPGGIPAYSNYGTALAGYIVERVSGERYEDYVERHIFTPLKMKQSSFRQPLPALLQGNMAKSYIRAGEPAQPFELFNVAPAGGLTSSGPDMAKFMIAHLQNGSPLLKPETARMMHDFKVSAFPGLPPMALGFYRNDINGRKIIAHGGDVAGFHSDIQLMLDDNIGIYISTNSDGDNVTNIRADLLSGFIHRYFPRNVQDSRVDAKTARLHAQQVAGVYKLSRRTDSNFGRLGSLVMQLPIVANDDGSLGISFGGPQTRYLEISPYLWRADNGDELLNVTMNGDKPVLAATSRFGAIMAMQAIPFWQSSAFILPLVGGSILILLVGLVGYPFGALVRRSYGITQNALKPSGYGRPARAVAASLALIACGLWLYLVSVGLKHGGFTDDQDSLILMAQTVGLVAWITGLIAIVFTVRECFSKEITMIHRVSIIIWGAAMTMFVWFLFYFNLMRAGQAF